MSLLPKFLDRLPTSLASRAFGFVSDVEFASPVQRVVNSAFAHLAHINVSEAEHPVSSYRSLNALFTRRLRPDVRTVAPGALVSPVDGRLSHLGVASHGTTVEAKGHPYRLEELLAVTDGEPWFEDAYVFTIYLSPSDYHHIHAPMSGRVVSMSYAPGRLLPVNRLGYLLADDLLPANERLTSFVVDARGHRVAVVKVGATCVGRISVEYDDFRTNAGRLRQGFFRELPTPYAVEAGDPLGCFELGSTVVLVVERRDFVPEVGLECGQRMRYGQALGRWESDPA